MTAGLHTKCSIWRFSYPSDDKVGGAQPSGTVLYSNVSTRLEAVEPTQALLEQGLEIPTIFHAVLSPGTMKIRANDQLEVTGPAISPYLHERFRVIGMMSSSMIDPRGFVVLTLRRIETAMDNVYQ